ncbi:MAG: A/G-specific adenine glycosylase [Patescibacteria group bacterium]|nr:A/G-specific adenine glycosylase [Patescibacteria group bacterium]
MPSNIDTKQLRKFEREIWNYYEGNKRDLPWRRTTNPYYILISEVMLQQTQVSRVILKYEEFIKKFGTIESLARASKAEVLTLWQGLGYNRRALFLKRACETLFTESLKLSKSTSKPKFPTTREELLKLPGIGQSTAGALLAFAFNTPVPFIETNIRAVFLYFFFKESSSVSDIHIYELLQETLNHKKQIENPREWYYALYDYGTMLKAKLGREKTALHKQSKHYNKQSTFKGSNREIRGAILRLFTKHSKINEQKICALLDAELPHRTPTDISKQVTSSLTSLEKEGFIQKTDAKTSKTSIKPSVRERKSTPPAYTLSVV